MRKIILLLVLAITNFTAFCQLNLTITTQLGQDTIYPCPGQTVNFYAKTTDNGTEVIGNYKWEFDDGTIFQGIGTDTVRFSFQQNGVHRVLVSSTYNNDTAYGGIIAIIGMPPIFNGSKIIYAGNAKGLCPGDELTLVAKVEQNPYTEKRTTEYIEPFAFTINNSLVYKNAITRRSFNYGAKYQSGDLDSVGLLIVHPNSQEIQVKLTAPNGKTIVLKDFGGNPNTFGAPSQNTDGAKWYFWKNTSALGTINSLSISGEEIPPESYQADESFDNFESSLLNGQWQITVTDNTAGNDGYILGWALFFSQNTETDSINYTNTYDLLHAFWDGDNVNLTSYGQATASPVEYGGHKYTFYIRDNWGCFHDTSLIAQVEEVHFEVDKPALDIGDSLKVEDYTSWATDWRWDFGDQTSETSEKSFYHKYYEKGNYIITLTAISINGCQDFDTAKITVSPRPIELPDYNVFTPNGDGVNDVFNFFNKPDDKITAANIETISGKIYDRNGKVVCKWTSAEDALKGWDGTYMNNGKQTLPEGIYYYIIIIKGKDGKDYEPFRGFIYLYK